MGIWRLLSLLVSVVVAGVCLAGTSAGAAPASYVLTSDTAAIDDSGEDPTVDVTLINLTDEDAPVGVSTDEGGDSCEPSSETLAASREQTLTFTLDGCDFGDDTTIDLVVDVAGTTFEVTGEIEEETDPEWGILWWFLAPLGAGVIVVLIGYTRFLKKPGGAPVPAKPWWKRLLTPLPYLGAGWSFKDSWAANVTVISALFTGLFGTSDLLETTTGAEAPSVLAVITVASAISVGLISVAPLLLQTVRNDSDQIRLVALLGSAAMAVGASGGLALVIVVSVSTLVTGGAQVALCGFSTLAFVLLAAYAITSVRKNLITGLKKPPSKKSAEEVARAAAKDAVQGMAPSRSDSDARRLEESLATGLEKALEPAHTPTHRDYPSALI